MEQPRIVPKAEVTETLVRNILNDQAEFKDLISPLKHGQKQRLLEAMAVYPLQELEFDESEPEMRQIYTVWKRINDSLVALGTEAAIEGIINGHLQQQQQGVENVETKE
jgi:hypothetical protein